MVAPMSERKYVVSIGGGAGELWTDMAALNRAGIPTVGAFPDHFMRGPIEDFTLHGLSAHVEAETAEDARLRVKDVLPHRNVTLEVDAT